MTETLDDLALMDMDELRARLEGGFYGLIVEDEEYADLVRIATALGIKDFVNTKLANADKAQFLELFADGEQVITQFLNHATEKGLLEPEDSSEEAED